MKNLLCLLCLLPLWLGGQKFGWVATTGGSGVDQALAVKTDAAGNVYAAGEWWGTADLDPGPGVNLVTAVGPSDLYLQKFDASGNLIWVRTFVGTGIAATGYGHQSIAVDGLGNVTLAGYFTGTVDMDPGPAVVNVSDTTTGAFVLRLDPAGNFVWVKTVVGNQGAGAMCVAVVLDASGGIYLYGKTTGNVDIDPGPGILMSGTSGGVDFCLLKLDFNGNLVWGKSFGGIGSNEPFSLCLAGGDQLVVAGRFEYTVDFDAGPGVATHTSSNAYDDVFVAGYDTAGNFQWVSPLQGDLHESVTGLATDSQGNIYVAGSFGDTVDFDPGPGAAVLMPLNGPTTPPKIFLWSLDPLGQYRWAKWLGNEHSQGVWDIVVDAGDDLYVSGTLDHDLDMDPGPGQYFLRPTVAGEFAIFMARFATAGELIWADVYPSSPGNASLSALIDVGSSGAIVAAGGFTGTWDIDLSDTAQAMVTSNGDRDVFVLKLLPDSCAGLAVRIDSFMDLTCAVPLGSVTAVAFGGTAPYAYVWNSIPPTLDSVMVTNGGGLYEVTVTDAVGCATTWGVLVNGPQLINGWDLQGQIVAGVFQPGQPTTIAADYHNEGCQNVSGLIVMGLDPLLQYITAVPLPDSIHGDTLFWNYPAMNYDSAAIHLEIQVATSVLATNGDSIHLGYSIDPVVGDGYPVDNVRWDYLFPVDNSFDPNVIAVYPLGSCAERYVDLAEPLTYTIQFQNTGNADAIDIVVEDTLDSDLDVLTLDVKASSHAMVTEWMPGGILRFTFADIHLPDSSTNEAGSHGYLVYEIMPKVGVVSGTEVRNGAAIYFDWNPGIVTNVVMNTLVDVVPACGVRVVEGSDGVDGLVLYPNPASSSVRLLGDGLLGEVRIVNVMGQVVWEKGDIQTRALSLDVRGWAKGIYFVRLGSGGPVVRLVVE